MSHQNSFVHHFVPPNAQVKEKVLSKSSFISENYQKNTLKSCHLRPYKIIMINQKSFVHFLISL